MNDISINQHNIEIQQNLKYWANKPILQTIYMEFYRIINEHINSSTQGKIVELGSGIGNIKMLIPNSICTDIFENPWIDQVENLYSLSFADNSVSTLILFDVFHHIQYPGSALHEFNRVLIPGGQIIIFDPSISLTGRIVYGLFHHEPIGWFKKIKWFTPKNFNPWDSPYYASQGNSSRIFFSKKYLSYLTDFSITVKLKFSAFSYILSGGYSKPQLFASKHFNKIKKVEKILDYFPILFSTRSLVVLNKMK